MIWHEELYKIYKQGRVWSTKTQRGFRLYTKRQLLYVVAGGTSIHTKVHYANFCIVTKNNTDYLQITSSWYQQHKITFDQCLTYTDELKLKLQETKTKPLDSFFKVVRKETKTRIRRT